MRRNGRRLALALSLTLACALGASAPVAAQPLLDGREQLAADRPEAWAMRWFAAALAPAGTAPGGATQAGRIDLGLDLGWLPSLSARQRTIGFDGTKVEDLNRAPMAPTPRARFGLPAGFVLDLGWIPPAEVDGARANLLSLGLARTLAERGPWRLGARLTARHGRLSGDFTCPAAAAAAGADPVRNPYGCAAASDDRMDLDLFGAELGLAWRPVATPALALWLSGSAWRLDSTFQVQADWGGVRDRTRLDYAGTDWGLATGLSWRPSDAWEGTAELRWTPLDVARPADGGGTRTDALLQVVAGFAYRVR